MKHTRCALRLGHAGPHLWIRTTLTSVLLGECDATYDGTDRPVPNNVVRPMQWRPRYSKDEINDVDGRS